MSSPLLRWIVLGFACLWFGMLVPVHQRGQIKLPGVAATAAPGGAGRHCDAGTACHKKQAAVPQPRRQQPQPASETDGCAVCHFIAGLHAPPPVTAYEARLGLSRELPPDHEPVVPLRHAALPFHGLDPPTV